jgi:5'-deoxynucleotidase YfbR-like HD superfamily hydrolase
MEHRKGDWQETYMGKFYAIDPRSDEVNLVDIAHGLSQICRFTGQCKHFYSVAQHCLNVYRDLEQLGYDYTIQLIGLLHDASECYISDLPKPFKVEIPQYKVFEEKIEKAIYDRFHLPFPTDEIHKIIKFSDNEVLYNEVEQLMNNVENWTLKYPHRKLDIDTKFRNMEEVEQEYLEIAYKLINNLQKM